MFIKCPATRRYGEPSFEAPVRCATLIWSAKIVYSRWIRSALVIEADIEDGTFYRFEASHPNQRVTPAFQRAQIGWRVVPDNLKWPEKQSLIPATVKKRWESEIPLMEHQRTGRLQRNEQTQQWFAVVDSTQILIPGIMLTMNAEWKNRAYVVERKSFRNTTAKYLSALIRTTEETDRIISQAGKISQQSF